MTSLVTRPQRTAMAFTVRPLGTSITADVPHTSLPFFTVSLLVPSYGGYAAVKGVDDIAVPGLGVYPEFVL